MIIWLSSYPKSGNTYIRSFLTAYYYTSDGVFDFSLLKYIEQFPDKQFFTGIVSSKELAAKNWLPAQKEITKSKKVKILKTHSAYGSYDDNPFTNAEVTIGGVYIVRDPRNVVSSLMRHFSLEKEQAVDMILDENRAIKSKDNNYATFSFLSSWSNHYNSWRNIKSFRTILIRYEDLSNNNESIFKNLIKFINNLLNNNQGLDHQKFNRALETTSFEFLKKKELEGGFLEAIYSDKDGKKIPFFNKGFQNQWKEVLDDNIIRRIESKFKNEMKELGYL